MGDHGSAGGLAGWSRKPREVQQRSWADGRLVASPAPATLCGGVCVGFCVCCCFFF